MCSVFDNSMTKAGRLLTSVYTDTVVIHIINLLCGNSGELCDFVTILFNLFNFHFSQTVQFIRASCTCK